MQHDKGGHGARLARIRPLIDFTKRGEQYDLILATTATIHCQRIHVP